MIRRFWSYPALSMAILLAACSGAPPTPTPYANGMPQITKTEVSDVSSEKGRTSPFKVTVAAPGCPDWRRDPAQDPSNALAAGFGCATAHNFAAMIARPTDLVQGVHPAPPWALPSANPRSSNSQGAERGPSSTASRGEGG